jgi:hypothetical protein
VKDIQPHNIRRKFRVEEKKGKIKYFEQTQAGLQYRFYLFRGAVQVTWQKITCSCTSMGQYLTVPHAL